MPPRRQNTSSASPAPQTQVQGQQPQQQQTQSTSQQVQGQTTTNGYSTAGATQLALPGSSQAQTGWNRGSIPIDPALQASSAQQYANYYQQYQQHYGAYSQHYAQAQAQAQAQSQTQTQTQTQSTSAARTGGQASGSGGGGGTGGGNEDIANMTDVLGAAGVDLRAEEEGLQRSHTTYRLPLSNSQYADRARRSAQQNPHIGVAIRTIASHHGVPKVPDESIHYLTYALQSRLEEIVSQAIQAANHRKRSSALEPPPLYEDGTPMWSKVIRRDLAKQLAVIERVEREEEMRIRAERKAADDAVEAAKEAVNPNGTPQHLIDDDHPKKKRKKDLGPGVIAKTMSEETRKKMSNAAASHAAGLLNAKKYAWMNAGNVPPSQGSRPKIEPQIIAPGKGGTGTSEPGVLDSGGRALPIKPGATDAVAAVAAANAAAAAGSGGGSGAGKGWARGRIVIGSEKNSQERNEEDTRMQITMRDLLFVVGKERGHGGGRGSARGWT